MGKNGGRGDLQRGRFSVVSRAEEKCKTEQVSARRTYKELCIEMILKMNINVLGKAQFVVMSPQEAWIHFIIIVILPWVCSNPDIVFLDFLGVDGFSPGRKKREVPDGKPRRMWPSYSLATQLHR